MFDKKLYFEVLEELIYFSKKKHNLRPALEKFVMTLSGRSKEVTPIKELEKFLLKFVEITEGKIYAEVERTKAVTQLTSIWEGINDSERALDLILLTPAHQH